ncbi:MAG TPA: hypothetical protein DCM87_00775, partial [Planctomycetes bacterium]|nr:hypothetical protein [Planctomycetota bacterium]
MRSAHAESAGTRRIAIAGIGIELAASAGGPRIELQGAVARFETGGAAPDTRVDVAWGELVDAPAGREVFDSGAHWRLHEDGDGLAFTFRSRAMGPFPVRRARFSRDFARGEVVYHRPYFGEDATFYPLGYPLDELLVTHLLAAGRGVELHACGIVDAAGRGHLFVGQSGAGKTTMARHWERHEGAVVLSDDRIVVRRHGNELRMHGTPWHGEAALSAPGSAPLARVYFIRRDGTAGAAPRFRSLAGAAYAARLYSCVFCPFYCARAV